MQKVFDLSGLMCPIPVLKTKKILADILSGENVEIITTDPASKNDLQEFCKKTGNSIIEQRLELNKIITIIKRR
ncbi:MAG: sulfurtransferase TusA family protein [Burkholderiales bacterium]|nr:sulfurtransferase TusA family protein [Burkholderiales bacterium]